ncbi:DUF1127 domain-containing protein [Tabrizicola sp. J26]|uniref:DUF1127 domain-containing protein n=1 Tax=Alitabrizicola rongguiensis TaxID=2909234 RepID=UPI001F2A577D|nr:DUF1127 domain-containing protein [Tabrizicola rongguiensis]MCF1708965.1 DUF1127 domain-containing protein [Tabrizicola rongguiensis]
MSYVTTSTAVRAGLPDRLSAMRKAVADMLRKRRLYNQTFRELAVLTDRELADLGINRTLIPEIAAQAAYGK